MCSAPVGFFLFWVRFWVKLKPEAATSKLHPVDKVSF